MTNTDTVIKRVYSVNEFCAAYGLGRTSVYNEIQSGRLKVAKVGKRTLVPIEEADRWLAERTDR